MRNEGNSSSPETRRGLLQQQQHHRGATCACRDLIRDLCPSSVSKLREAAPRLDFRCTERIFMPPYDGRPLSSFLCARPPVLYSRQTSAGSLVNAITCFSHKRDARVGHIWLLPRPVATIPRASPNYADVHRPCTIGSFNPMLE